jgi:hypothetical protein
VLRKEVYLDCITPTNSVPIPPGESQDIHQTIQSVFGDNLEHNIYGDELPGIENYIEDSEDEWTSKSSVLAPVTTDWIQNQMSAKSSLDQLNVKRMTLQAKSLQNSKNHVGPKPKHDFPKTSKKQIFTCEEINNL